MYIRPGNLAREFYVEEKSQFTDAHGRVRDSYAPKYFPAVDDEDTNLIPVIIRGVLAETKPDETERWRQLQHSVSHTIVQYGPPLAKPEDRLKLGERTFYVEGVDNIDGLDVVTVYYADERADTNANND